MDLVILMLKAIVHPRINKFCPSTVWLPTFFKIFSFVFGRRNELKEKKQVWMMTEFIYLLVNYPFNSIWSPLTFTVWKGAA